MKTVVLILLMSCVAAQAQVLPDNPSPQQPTMARSPHWPHWRCCYVPPDHGIDPHWRAIGKKGQWPWWAWGAVHVAYGVSLIGDAETTWAATSPGRSGHATKCVESNRALGWFPTRSDMYKNSLLPFVLFTGADAVFQHYKLPFLPYAGPIWETQRHARATVYTLENCF